MRTIYRVLGVLTLALLAACGSSTVTTPDMEQITKFEQEATPEVITSAPEPKPTLTAFVDGDAACHVTNLTGKDQIIRYRIGKVLDLADPANYKKQEQVVDFTRVVLSGAQDSKVYYREFKLLCTGLYQIDCGRSGGGLLAYKFINVSHECGLK